MRATVRALAETVCSLVGRHPGETKVSIEAGRETMASVVGITLVKKMTYRTLYEEWSNTYHLTGSVPASTAAWDTLVDALIAQEKTCYPADHSVVRAYGYDSDADDATSVYVRDLSATPVAGTMATTGGTKTAGDAAAWVRWKTSRTSSTGKAIYLRKYFHGVMVDLTISPDQVLGAQRTVYAAFATKLKDGSFAEARTIRSQHNAETIIASSVANYLTTRTLKRRGKRPGA